MWQVAGEEVAQIVGEVDVRWVGVFVTFDDLVAALLVGGVEKEGVEVDRQYAFITSRTAWFDAI